MSTHVIAIREVLLGFANSLIRKKAEQAEAREAIQQQKGAESKVGGALGQQGGPANPVDNPLQGGNYPNTGV